MNGLGGILTAALALIALQVVTSSRTASGNVASLLQYPATVAEKWMSPDVALIPQRGAPPSDTPAQRPASSGAAGMSTLNHPS